MQNNSGGIGRIYISDGANYTYALGSLFATSTETTFSKTITPTQSTVRLYAYNTGSGSTTYDNISVRIAVEDRSVNNKGLQVFGTITKNPVATGADLVAYSGFSASNYLQQPYNSDLDFGTGDFCVMGWFKQAETSLYRPIVDRDSATTAQRFTAGIIASNSLLVFSYDDGGTTLDIFSSQAVDNNSWQFFCGVRSGNDLLLYLNCNLEDSADVSGKGSISNSTAVLCIGNQARSAKLASCIENTSLIRISATAPTA